MTAIHPSLHDSTSDPLTTALRTALILEQGESGAARNETEMPQPFVTISRQAGAGGKSFGRALVDRLNTKVHSGPRWTLWDDELVQKVAKEHALAEAYIQALEDQPHGWFHDFLNGLAFGSNDRHPDEFKVYRRVASTIRALARAGRAVLVGRGGAFLTADLAAGIHMRIVAPAEFRVREMARRLNISTDAAADVVREIEHNRAVFYRRYWPNKSTESESFTMTLNSGKIDPERMVDCVLPLLISKGKCAGAGGCGCDRKVDRLVP